MNGDVEHWREVAMVRTVDDGTGSDDAGDGRVCALNITYLVQIPFTGGLLLHHILQHLPRQAS